MTVTEIDTEIVSLKEQLAACKGTECEVYARIVGYYARATRVNIGKQEELKIRVPFDIRKVLDRLPVI